MKGSVTTNYADSVRQTGLWNVPGVAPPIAEATVVRFDNVAQYWIDQNAHHTYGLLKAFPCLALPFPVLWLETRRPRAYRGQPVPSLTFGNGCFIFPDRYAVLLMSLPAEDISAPCPPEACWAVRAHLIVDGPSYGVPHPSAAGATHCHFNGNVWFSEWAFFLDGEGKALSDRPATTRPGLLAPHDRTAQQIVTAAEARGFSDQYTRILLGPAFFALSLMHCKNVNTQWAQPLPAKFVKGYRKRHGVSPSRHRTINITSMTKIINQHMGATGQTLVQSLHLCRGHFKDFSAGKGLFGKLRGRYWWSPQVRGTGATGAITHDYTVSP